ncbi:MAG: 16S rRNA (guanine(527)-N(7))-methyltransferase RsmG [Candidatus Electrothrix sp. YB6]
MCDRRYFRKGLDRLALRLSEDRTDKLLRYCRELEKWSRRINLIARDTTAADIVEKHFLDSLALMPLIAQYSKETSSTGTTLLDVGSGAGFPGLVLAAAMPKLHVTLAEPRQKRVSFLRHIIRTLQLGNVEVTDKRIEPGQHREDQEKFTFHFITGRAVASADIFLPMVENIAAQDTIVILMSGNDGENSSPEKRQKEQKEIGIAEKWERIGKKEFSLPFSGHPRVLTLVRRRSL